MPRGRGRPKKDPFSLVSEDEKDTYATLDAVGLKAQMAKVAMNEQDNQKAMEDDQDLQDLKGQVKLAGEAYKDATKANKQRLAFLRQVLEAKGGA